MKSTQEDQRATIETRAKTFETSKNILYLKMVNRYGVRIEIE